MTGTLVPPRAVTLRALALELERLASHLGDLGALGNDGGLTFGQTQFSALKERLLRRHADAFGQRYLFDLLVPGGVSVDPEAPALAGLSAELSDIEKDMRELRTLYADHAGLQDRLRGTGRLSLAQARTLGALGLAARACGIDRDLRADMPWPPYDRLTPTVAACADGDVAARVQVRFEEALESLRLCRQWLEDMPTGEIRSELSEATPGQRGFGLIEGWRGPVMVALESGAEGGIRRCHVHDPSWQNWLLLERAVLDNIVADFPLINKSFNLSYSGHDG
jgi:Ni,Fe-hydrogenase III large subunit